MKLPLTFGQTLSTNSKDIYKECCASSLDWDPSHEGRFGRQQQLFAPNACKDRIRDVWFIAHSNMNDDTPLGGDYVNVIADPRIFEIHSKPMESVTNQRIVFAKDEKGQYVFLGVYQIEKEKKQSRSFIRVSTQFPL